MLRVKELIFSCCRVVVIVVVSTSCTCSFDALLFHHGGCCNLCSRLRRCSIAVRLVTCLACHSGMILRLICLVQARIGGTLRWLIPDFLALGPGFLSRFSTY